MAAANNQQPDQGSFVAGFTVGIFAGVAGYFLFATDKGNKMRKSLEKEWGDAREVLGEAEIPAKTLGEMLFSLWTTWKGAVAESAGTTEALKNGRRPARLSPAKESKPKFRGV